MESPEIKEKKSRHSFFSNNLRTQPYSNIESHLKDLSPLKRILQRTKWKIGDLWRGFSYNKEWPTRKHEQNLIITDEKFRPTRFRFDCFREGIAGTDYGFTNHLKTPCNQDGIFFDILHNFVAVADGVTNSRASQKTVAIFLNYFRMAMEGILPFDIDKNKYQVRKQQNDGMEKDFSYHCDRYPSVFYDYYPPIKIPIKKNYFDQVEKPIGCEDKYFRYDTPACHFIAPGITIQDIHKWTHETLKRASEDRKDDKWGFYGEKETKTSSYDNRFNKYSHFNNIGGGICYAAVKFLPTYDKAIIYWAGDVAVYHYSSQASTFSAVNNYNEDTIYEHEWSEHPVLNNYIDEEKEGDPNIQIIDMNKGDAIWIFTDGAYHNFNLLYMSAAQSLKLASLLQGKHPAQKCISYMYNEIKQKSKSYNCYCPDNFSMVGLIDYRGKNDFYDSEDIETIWG